MQQSTLHHTNIERQQVMYEFQIRTKSKEHRLIYLIYKSSFLGPHGSSRVIQWLLVTH